MAILLKINKNIRMIFKNSKIQKFKMSQSQTIQEIAERNGVVNFGSGLIDHYYAFWYIPQLTGLKVDYFIDYSDELVKKLASQTQPMTILEFFDTLYICCQPSTQQLMSQFLYEKLNSGYFNEYIANVFYELQFPSDVINMIASFVENPHRIQIQVQNSIDEIKIIHRGTIQNVSELLKYFCLTIETKKIILPVEKHTCIYRSSIKRVQGVFADRYISSDEIFPLKKNHKVHKIYFADPTLIHHIKSITIKNANVLGESFLYHFKQANHNIWECCFSTIDNITNKNGEILNFSQRHQYNPIYVDFRRDKFTIDIEWINLTQLLNNTLQFHFIYEPIV